MSNTYQGQCFCGAVQFTVTGSAGAMGYCHCESCRSWSASPINAFSLWPKDALKITKGADNIATYNKTERSYRKWCKTCGGHVFTDHPAWGQVDVYAAMIPAFKFEPHLHVFYAEKMISIKDGLPKMKDVPKEFGGSGETMPE